MFEVDEGTTVVGVDNVVAVVIVVEAVEVGVVDVVVCGFLK